MQEGFGSSEDGNINIIRGSHVFRDTSCRASPGRAGDAELAEGWLVGKRHPTTGAPLRTEELQLAPGSVVCCNTHAAHMVSPKAQGSRTRLACSWFFKKRSDATGFTCECKTPAQGQLARGTSLPDCNVRAQVRRLRFLRRWRWPERRGGCRKGSRRCSAMPGSLASPTAARSTTAFSARPGTASDVSTLYK